MNINTIFYFIGSLSFEDYVTKLANGEISKRTIVFADEQKAIYKNGIKFGGTTYQEFHEMIDQAYDDSWISDEINGIKGDISDARERLRGLDIMLDSLSGRLDGEINSLDSNIKNKIEQLFKESEWVEENFPQSITDWHQGWDSELERYLRYVGYWDIDPNTGEKTTKWSKLDQRTTSIEQSVNNIKVNGNLSQAMQSSIHQLIDGDIANLELSTTYASKDAEKIVEWLYSGLKSSTLPDKTFNELKSVAKNDFMNAISSVRTQIDKLENGDYVATTDVSTKVGDVISAMLLQSSESNGLASLAARMGSVENKADSNESHIASLILGITGSSSTADLTTSISNAISGITSTASNDADGKVATAKSEIYSAISAIGDNNEFISLSALKTQADNDHATLQAISQTSQGGQVDTSGFVTRTDLGTAVAELFASSGTNSSTTAKASVVALVKDNKSSLELTAEDVNINGYLTAGDATFKGDIEATSFTTGSANEVGIGVMSGEFDPVLANTNKAYFAYDSTQGGVTMWFYQNGSWKRIDLASSSVADSPDSFATVTYYNMSAISDSATELPASVPTTTFYYHRVTGKYYTQASLSSSLVSGKYFYVSGGQASSLYTLYTQLQTSGTRHLENPTNDTPYNGSSLGGGDVFSAPAQLNIGNAYLCGAYPYWGGNNFSITEITFTNGVSSVTNKYTISYIPVAINWHASGSALPSGLLGLDNNTTPSTSDEFLYVTLSPRFIWSQSGGYYQRNITVVPGEYYYQPYYDVLYKAKWQQGSSNYRTRYIGGTLAQVRDFDGSNIQSDGAPDNEVLKHNTTEEMTNVKVYYVLTEPLNHGLS